MDQHIVHTLAEALSACRHELEALGRNETDFILGEAEVTFNVEV